MNPNYSETITIYNCLKARDSHERRETWWRKVIHGVSWKDAQESTMGGNEGSKLNESRKSPVTIRIPQNDDFRAYSEWKENPSLYFTVSEGDIIVLGECESEITGTSPNTASQILSMPDARRVKTVSDNTRFRFGKHIKVGG